MREHRALTHEATSDARREEEARVRERKERVRAGVVRLIWNEHEKPEAEELEAEVDERLGEHALLADDFMTAPIELLIGRLAAELGLSLPLAGALPTPAVSADSS